MNWIRTKEMVKTIIMEFTRERSLMHGAALAYYSMLALIPMLYLSISYVGMIVGNDVIIGVIESVLNEWIGIEDAGGIISFLDEVDFNKSSWVLQLAGILALLFSCTAIFNSMRRSLNAFYGIDDIIIPRKKVILRNLLSRLTSMLFVFGATLLFVVIYFMETIFMSFSTKFLEDVEWLNTLFLTIFNNGLPILTNFKDSSTFQDVAYPPGSKKYHLEKPI